MSLDYRCPTCGKLYPLADYVCLGGWETHPPGGWAAAPHPPVAVEPRFPPP